MNTEFRCWMLASRCPLCIQHLGFVLKQSLAASIDVPKRACAVRNYSTGRLSRFSPAGRVEVDNAVHDDLLLVGGQFREDRQAQHFCGGAFGFRQAARFVSQLTEAFLLV